MLDAEEKFGKIGKEEIDWSRHCNCTDQRGKARLVNGDRSFRISSVIPSSFASGTVCMLGCHALASSSLFLPNRDRYSVACLASKPNGKERKRTEKSVGEKSPRRN